MQLLFEALIHNVHAVRDCDGFSLSVSSITIGRRYCYICIGSYIRRHCSGHLPFRIIIIHKGS